MKHAFDFWDTLTDSQKKNLQKVAQKYGANKWWESTDVATILYGQIHERIQVVSFPEYLDALGRFMDRPVDGLTIAFSRNKLIKDFEVIYRRKVSGIAESEEQREAGHVDYTRNIEKIIREHIPKDRMITIDSSTL